MLAGAFIKYGHIFLPQAQPFFQKNLFFPEKWKIYLDKSTSLGYNKTVVQGGYPPIPITPRRGETENTLM